MKRSSALLLILLLLMISPPLFGQSITRVEYYIDSDTGVGSGINVPIIAGSTVEVNFSAALSGLTPGIHHLYVRAQDSNESWSLPKAHTFFADRYSLASTANIVAAEYFFDTDPGVGGGTTIPVSPSGSIDVNFAADVSSLTPGQHVLFVRGSDADGHWSTPEARYFFVNRLTTDELLDVVGFETYFDTDPGPGNRTYHSITPGSEVQVVFAEEVSSLTPGQHTCYTVAVHENGERSVPVARHIFIDPHSIETPENLAEVEYFFDTDPGPGEGTTVATGASDEADLGFPVDVSSLSLGQHTLYLRTRDALNCWGLTTARHILVQPRVGSDPPAQLVRIEYAFAQEGSITDTSTVTIDPAASEADVNFTASLLDLTLGQEYRANVVAVDQDGVPSIPYVHTFTYSDFNTAPYILEPVTDQLLAEDFEGYELVQLSSLFNDIDIPFGDHLAFAAEVRQSLVTAEIVDGSLLLGPVTNAYGLDTLLITATDDSLASVIDTVLISIQQRNDPPLAFHKITPADNTTFAEDSVEVVWSSSSDIDPGSALQYVVQWSDVEAFDVLQEVTLSDTSYIIGELELDALAVQRDRWEQGIRDLGQPTKVARTPRRTTPASRWTADVLGTKAVEKQLTASRKVESSQRGPAATNSLDELPDDRTIYWRVKAVDDSSAVTWADDSEAGWSFHIDQPEAPGEFDLVEPVSETEIVEAAVTLRWRISSDPDPYDTVHYDVWLDTLATLATAVQVSDSIADTSVVYSGLLDNHEYWWCVRATDSNTPGTWASDTLMFQTNIPDIPVAFTLIAPEDESIITSASVDFLWHTATDPDPEDIVRYDVWVDTIESFVVEAPIADSLLDSTLIFEGLADDDTYWWCVRAFDSQGGERWSSDTLMFALAIPEPPNSFSLLSPDSGIVFPDEREFPLVFHWQANGDPDPGDVVEYVFQISNSEGFESPAEYHIEGVDSAVVDELPIDFYYWRVLASDGEDSTWSTETWTIDVTLTVDDPWSGLPIRYALESAYPNPFNPSITVVVGLPDPSELRVEVYNLLGRRVAVLADDIRPAGYQKLLWNATGHASGVYFLRVSVPGKLEDRKKVVLIR